jgi:multimeric flavodoxin WrbA
MINILGICGSPVKDSNTELLLSEALKAVQKAEVRTDLFTLHDKKFEDCRHCNWCMAKQTENNFCAIKDDMQELFPKVVEPGFGPGPLTLHTLRKAICGWHEI